MQSREFKCFSKLITVCNNRGFSNLASDILQILGPNFLNKQEIKQLKSFGLSKQPSDYSNKISFVKSINYPKQCGKCTLTVNKQEPAFLHGKIMYHVLCGLESCGDSASENIFYKRWLVSTKSNNEEKK